MEGTVRPATAVGVLLAAAVAWGLAWLPLKHLGARGVEGVPLVLVAYATGTLVMGGALVFSGGMAWRGERRYLLGIALLGGYANLAFLTAMLYGDVVRVMVLFYLLPVWGVLGGRLFLAEAIDRQRWVAVILALAGAFLVLGGMEALQGAVGWLDLLALSSGLAFAMNNLLFRARQGLPVRAKVTAMFAGCAAIAGVLLAFGVQEVPEVGPGTWGWVAAFGVGWLLLATLGTQYGVTHMEAGRASVLIVMELVSAVLSATLIGGETISGGEAAGGLMILTAALLEAWPRQPWLTARQTDG